MAKTFAQLSIGLLPSSLMYAGRLVRSELPQLADKDGRSVPGGCVKLTLEALVGDCERLLIVRGSDKR